MIWESKAMTVEISEGLRTATDEQLRQALKAADPMALIGLIYHATGDEELHSVQTITVPAGFAEANVIAREEQADWVRERAFQLAVDYRDGKAKPPASVTDERLIESMSLAAGEQVPNEEFGLHADILSLDSAPRGWGEGPRRGSVADFNVIVIGAGLAGVNAAIELKASGIDFTLLEKNAGVGGTWYNNRYPGARVDWPSRLYSHSFGVDFPFQHPFAPRAENEAYIRWCVDRYEIEPNIEYETEVTELRWDDSGGKWIVDYRGADGRTGRRTARAIISAIGLLERPFVPDIPGIEAFQGQLFHSSRFDPEVVLAGKRVAVVGTGASGLQMVPDLAPLVGQVTVFQRSPAWVLPIPGYRDPLPEGAVWLNANIPYYANWTRFVLGWILGDHKLFKVFEVDPTWPDPLSVNAQNQGARNLAYGHLQEKLKDRPDLIEMVTPDYPIFGNRPVIDNGWFDAILRDNVELTTAGIERFTERGIVTAAGEELKFDIVVMATGFRPNQYFSPMTITGRGGVTVEELWRKDGPRAYWGVAVPSLPNFFILYGPNANPRNLGPVQYGEWAVRHFLQCFNMMIENGWESMEIRDEAFERFNNEMDIRLDQLVSVNAKTRHESYYTNEHGRSAVQSPWSSKEVWRALSSVHLEDYRVVEGVDHPDSPVTVGII
jgi:4-hydroxyacetophenone monooxygenase